jgi:hypothetical protein
MKAANISETSIDFKRLFSYGTLSDVRPRNLNCLNVYIVQSLKLRLHITVMFPLSPCTSKSLGTDHSRGVSKQANGQSPHWSGQFVPGSPGIEPSWKHVWLVVGRGVKATGILGRGWAARLVSLERNVVHTLCSVGWNSGYSEVSKTTRIVRIRAASQLGPPCYRIKGKYDSTRSGNQGNMPNSLCNSNTMETKITCRVGWRNFKP